MPPWVGRGRSLGTSLGAFQAHQQVGMAGLGSRWLLPHTPGDKWQRAFQISGSTALWGMCHVCQKTIKKPLAGNAFAKPAPNTAPGCTFTCESGMQQPWSGKDSPNWAPWPCSSSFSSLILFYFFFILFLMSSAQENPMPPFCMVSISVPPVAIRAAFFVMKW